MNYACKYIFMMASTIVLVFACSNPVSTDKSANSNTNHNPGARLIAEMVDSLGGLERFRSLKDVEYTYTYRDEEGRQDVSLERYMYHGERSWARYEEHTKNLLPDKPGTIIQSYNGRTTWTTLDGVMLTDEGNLGTADFLRKTNYYWLNMMFKLMDPGLSYEAQGKKEFDGEVYDVVKVGFNEGVGDAQDVYVLFIHPDTKLVDKFLFTVMDFGRSEPLLMEVRYEEIDGLKWPVYRRYTPSDWDATVPEGSQWIEEISTKVRFDVGTDPGLFEYTQ